MAKKLLHSFLGLAASGIVMGMASCTNIDCPLDNQVEMVLNFYHYETQKVLSLSDTLSIYGVKGDTTQLLFNRAIGQRTIRVPLNVASERDTLLLRFSSSTETATDTLIVSHQPKSSVFHTLTKVNWHAHQNTSKLLTVQEVLVTNPNVAYENVEHLKVLLRPVAQ